MRKAYAMSRRLFVLGGLGTAVTLATGCDTKKKVPSGVAAVTRQVPSPEKIRKYASPLLVPPAMPKAGTVTSPGGAAADYYEISMRQFDQQILPAVYPKTTVWGYGAVGKKETFNAPSFTIEAEVGRPVRVKWVNDLVDDAGNFLPHLLPVDQTIHWANPGEGDGSRDMAGMDPSPYKGPVPMVTHVHGSHTHPESDGYPEAWFLPAAKDIPPASSTEGSSYAGNSALAEARQGQKWSPGSATFEYPNDQRATTLWYHDHAVGMTRLNVYAGPAGFYLLRGGPSDEVKNRDGQPAILPGSAKDPGAGGRVYEVPIVVQDRSFNADGSLFYPDNRAYFEDLEKQELDIPFIPDRACAGPSDISPIWNPEFFGSTIIVNGNTWPYFEVQPRRYRLRFLNGCQARFLILEFEDKRSMWQIGTEGGFLPEPVEAGSLLIAPAERLDVIVDFAGLEPGTTLRLLNIGPDEPYNGGEQVAADPTTTGQVMEFRVIAAAGADPTTAPNDLVLPAIVALGAPTVTRKLSLNEMDSETVKVVMKDDGSIALACGDKSAEVFGPQSARLGTVDKKGEGVPLLWSQKVTETPAVGTTEVWEIHNFTVDAHPIHIHQVMFEVIDRAALDGGKPRLPEAWETGLKDTVVALPQEITRIKARFDLPGTYVWHCHILEHEDNEMMRPYLVK